MILGMEIRVKVSEYVVKRIEALKKLKEGSFTNVACIRGNAMKHLPNFFFKGQVSMITFLKDLRILHRSR